MSRPAHLRVYRFDPGAVFEGGLVGAVERMQLATDTKLLDALFVAQDPEGGGLAAVDLAGGGAGGTFASLLDFRLDARRRHAITERTLAEHRGGVPLDADRGGRRHARGGYRDPRGPAHRRRGRPFSTTR